MSKVENGTTARIDSGSNSLAGLPVLADDMPVMFEDEGQEEMGDSDVHTWTMFFLLAGLEAHLRSQPHYRVFANLNLYYHPTQRRAYISPDVMVTEPARPLPRDLASYRIGEEGPAPVLTAEVLSRRTYEQGDLNRKPIIYAQLGIPEYILVDVTGEFLPQLLLLRRLQPDGTWQDERGADGGVTSRLGFRVVLEPDGQVRVLDAATGKPYPRPEEAQALAERWGAEAQARQQAEERGRQAEERGRQAEERIRELEAELARLRNKGS
jgi:Uma2 family endonuclease